jgi:hypothetical protein
LTDYARLAALTHGRWPKLGATHWRIGRSCAGCRESHGDDATRSQGVDRSPTLHRSGKTWRALPHHGCRPRSHRWVTREGPPRAVAPPRIWRGAEGQDRHRLADVAAVRAIASGSQQRTIKAISQRIARSESLPTPSNSATYRMGAAFGLDPAALSGHRRAFGLERRQSTRRLLTLTGKGCTGLALGVHRGQGGIGLAPLGSRRNGSIERVRACADRCD